MSEPKLDQRQTLLSAPEMSIHSWLAKGPQMMADQAVKPEGQASQISVDADQDDVGGFQLDLLGKQALSRSNALQKAPAKLCCSLPDRVFAANDMMKLVFLAAQIA